LANLKPLPFFLSLPERPESPPLGYAPPTDHIGSDSLIGIEIAPLIIEAAAGIRDDIGSLVILAQSFDRDFLVRISVADKIRQALSERSHCYPIAEKCSALQKNRH
jgi:hypothetical protein